MKTAFLLAAQYDGLPVIPLERVCADFFAPLSLPKFMLKLSSGEIGLPVIRMEKSQKGARGVHLNDLAAYIDKAAESARQEVKALRA